MHSTFYAVGFKVVEELRKDSDKEKEGLEDFLTTRRLVILTMSCFGGVWVEKIQELGREDVAVQSAVETWEELVTSGKAAQFSTAPEHRSFCYRFITFNVSKAERNWKEMDFESNISTMPSKKLDKVLGQFLVRSNETPCAHVPASWMPKNLQQLLSNASDQAETANSSTLPSSLTMRSQIVLPDLEKKYGIHFINLKKDSNIGNA